MIRGKVLEALLSQRAQRILKDFGYEENIKEVEINDFEGENFQDRRVKREDKRNEKGINT